MLQILIWKYVTLILPLYHILLFSASSSLPFLVVWSSFSINLSDSKMLPLATFAIVNILIYKYQAMVRQEQKKNGQEGAGVKVLLPSFSKTIKKLRFFTPKSSWKCPTSSKCFVLVLLKFMLAKTMPLGKILKL